MTYVADLGSQEPSPGAARTALGRPWPGTGAPAGRGVERSRSVAASTRYTSFAVSSAELTNVTESPMT